MATTITGALGADTITGLAGADTLTGGMGNNLYIVKSLLNVIVEPVIYGGIDTIQTNVLDSLKTYSLEKSPYVENLTYTGTVAAQLKGNALDNVIKASATAITNDTLYGADGNDSLYGYAGRDLLQGGMGNDMLDGGVGSDADTLIGGAGNDSYLNVTAADMVIETINAGYDTISTDATGGKYLDLRAAQLTNIEGLIYNSSVGAALHGNIASNSISSTSATGNDTLNGWDGNDTLNGGGGNDSLIGGIGDDNLTGGAGTDTLVGGSGNDLYFVDTLDSVNELANEGVDTLIGTQTSIAIAAYATTIENLIYTGTVGASITGNGLDNWIGGGSANDTIAAGAGNDKLIGGAGLDVLQGGAGDDMLYGGSVGNLQTRALLLNSEGSAPVTADDNAADTLIGGAGGDKYFIDNALDVITEVAADTGTDVIFSSIDISLNAYSNIEVLVLEDNPATSTAWFAEGSADNNIIIGNNNENYISGGAGNDTLTGDLDGSGTASGYYGYAPVTDVIDGGDGDDVLMSLASESLGYTYDYSTGKYVTYVSSYSSYTSNVLMGGAGNDFYVIQNDKTAIYDSTGYDTAYLMTSASLEAADGVERIILAGALAVKDAFATAAINQAKSLSGNGSTTGSSLVNSPAINATGNALNNAIYGNANNNLLRGLDGNDSLLGGAGNDTISGGEGNDSLLGDDGNDILDGGAGVDTLAGGAGDDTYDVNTGDVVTETATGGIDIIRSATLTSLVGYANIEGLEYSGTASVLLQNGTANTSVEMFTGGSGNDTLNGWGGNDKLSGGAGNDSLNGGDGDDLVQGGAGADTLDGGAGNDQLYGSSSSSSSSSSYYYDNSDTSANLLTGGAGSDTLHGSGGNDTLSGGSENDYLSGNTGNDSLSGDAGFDTLYGGDGNDTLNGGTESDTLYGDAGNDSLAGGDAYDYLYGGQGADTLDGGAGDDQLYAYSYYYDPYYYPYETLETSANLLTGGAGNDTLYGSGGNDTLSGGSENDYLSGNTGNDSLSGDAGVDTLYGGAGDDVLNGGADSDTLYGDAGNDSLAGSDGNDTMSGAEGNDTLNGGAGNDSLDGGAGDDILYAGEATAGIVIGGYLYGTVGDKLIGDYSYSSAYNTIGKDLFRFESTAVFASQSINDTSSGGVWNGTVWVYPTKDVFNTGHFIDDFTKLDDKIQFAKAMTGDGDALLENVATKAAAGGTFAKTAEMVIVQADLTTDFTYSYGGYWNSINASEVVAAIGKADTAFAIGDKRLFVVDDGISSALFQFTSAGADATVSAAELKLIGVVDGQASLSSSDFGLY